MGQESILYEERLNDGVVFDGELTAQINETDLVRFGIDLESPYNIQAIALSQFHRSFGHNNAHDQAGMRIFRDVVIQISKTEDFSSGVTTVFNNDKDNSVGQGTGYDLEYGALGVGMEFVLQEPVEGRYIRLYNGGFTTLDKTYHPYVNVVELEVYGESVTNSDSQYITVMDFDDSLEKPEHVDFGDGIGATKSIVKINDNHLYQVMFQEGGTKMNHNLVNIGKIGRIVDLRKTPTKLTFWAANNTAKDLSIDVGFRDHGYVYYYGNTVIKSGAKGYQEVTLKHLKREGSLPYASEDIIRSMQSIELRIRGDITGINNQTLHLDEFKIFQPTGELSGYTTLMNFDGTDQKPSNVDYGDNISVSREITTDWTYAHMKHAYLITFLDGVSESNYNILAVNNLNDLALGKGTPNKLSFWVQNKTKKAISLDVGIRDSQYVYYYKNIGIEEQFEGFKEVDLRSMKKEGHLPYANDSTINDLQSVEFRIRGDITGMQNETLSIDTIEVIK